ncbi:hypothetical protein [Streptomyces sp. NBC_01497]|nr:hypothetical protein [Streptomyces sp. NBC_01497]
MYLPAPRSCCSTPPAKKPDAGTLTTKGELIRPDVAPGVYL